jgi:hypothetical protein
VIWIIGYVAIIALFVVLWICVTDEDAGLLDRRKK